MVPAMEGCVSKSNFSLNLLYLQCYFITIATLLGSGILGLPVTLSKAGFYPFLVTFTSGYVMQVLVIISSLEILQYCKEILSQLTHTTLPDHDSAETLLLQRSHRQNSDEEDAENEEGGFGSGVSDHFDSSPVQDGQVTDPNLHMLGKLFLNKYLQPVFLLVMLVHFASALISYVLAGSEAYGQILKINYVHLIPVFCWVLTFIIITSRLVIRPVIALLTLAKGSVLVAVVAITVYTGVAVNNPISNDWRYTQGPFLMGTVALGGVPMVMPMLFDKFEMVRDQLKGFRNSMLGGITTCFLLNVIWCWSVLNIVPQTSETCRSAIADALFFQNYTTTTPVAGVPTTNSNMNAESPGKVTKKMCDPDISLEASDEKGEISTVPLTKIIITQHAELRWIAFVIQLFIVSSITVSFLTMGSALQHTICGWIDDIVAKHENCKFTGSCVWFLPRNWFWHYVFGVLAYLCVFAVSASNPKGFIQILERVASFCLNAMSGPFMFLMIREARSKTFRHIQILLPVPPCLKNAHYLYLCFYSFAVIYDIIAAAIEWSTGS